MHASQGALGELIWSQTLSLFPHLRDRVEYFNVGTVRTVYTYMYLYTYIYLYLPIYTYICVIYVRKYLVLFCVPSLIHSYVHLYTLIHTYAPLCTLTYTYVLLCTLIKTYNKHLPLNTLTLMYTYPYVSSPYTAGDEQPLPSLQQGGDVRG
jgi:hypothetical protein